jgi:hypothetical protein
MPPSALLAGAFVCSPAADKDVSAVVHGDDERHFGVGLGRLSLGTGAEVGVAGLGHDRCPVGDLEAQQDGRDVVADSLLR